MDLRSRHANPSTAPTNRQDMEPDSAWYESHPESEELKAATVQQGLCASNTEMDRLYESIRLRMGERQVLTRDISKLNLKDFQAERLKAVEAGLNSIEHFRKMMTVVNRHQKYKTQMNRALAYQCLQRWGREKHRMKLASHPRHQGEAAAKPATALESTPGNRDLPEPKTLKEELAGMKLGYRPVSIGLNGVQGMVTYLPLHLVPEEKPLMRRGLPSDEMKDRLQPEDLSFELLKELVRQDCGIQGWITVTCPQLEEIIVNERHFQTAVQSLLAMDFELKFMFSDGALVSGLGLGWDAVLVYPDLRL